MKKGIITSIFLMVLFLGLNIGLIAADINSHIEKINYSKIQTILETEDIDRIEVSRKKLTVRLYEDTTQKIYLSEIPSIDVFSEYINENIDFEKNDIEFNIVKKHTDRYEFATITLIFSGILSILTIAIVIYLVKKTRDFRRQMYSNNFDNTDEQKVEVKEIKIREVSFKDIAGIDKERKEIEEVISMIKEPKKYREIGAKIPKGILLSGEPGTGKTLIAKAMASEANLTFINCPASSLDHMYVGVGADKIREIFEFARENAPAIIFIDEIDAIAQKRYMSINNNSQAQTLNQLLTEMDGFVESDNIVVIAATNHIEVLDGAVTRPGRFDRIINIPLPNKKGRRDILGVHSKNKKFDENKDANLNELAKKTSGMSGADLANILNEAAIIAIDKKKDAISKEEIDEAFIKVILGISKEDAEISEKEKLLVAIHEAGHTITSRVLRPETEIIQVSIIPRGRAGGYNLYADNEENSLPTRSDMENDIIVSLGGRAAEDFYYNTISVGASADLESASKHAHAMVYKYAMGTKAQLVRLFGKEEYNDKLEEKMFPEMETILNDAYKKSTEIINKHSGLLVTLANILVKKSTLNSSELEELFSKHSI